MSQRILLFKLTIVLPEGLLNLLDLFVSLQYSNKWIALIEMGKKNVPCLSPVNSKHDISQ